MTMYCISAAIPPAACELDDELKAIYHSADCLCIFTFVSREQRNRFMDDTRGMSREQRTAFYEASHLPS